MLIGHNTSKATHQPIKRDAVAAKANADSPQDSVELSSDVPNKGLIRKSAEMVSGVANVAFSLPKAIIPAMVLGGIKGVDERTPEKESLTEETIGKWQAYAGAAQSVAQAGVMGLIGGPVAAAALAAMEIPREAAGLATFIQGGGAAQVGKELADSVRESVSPEDSKVSAMFKGSWAAVKSAVRETAKVRYQEGKGMVSGVIDGARNGYRDLKAEEANSAPQSTFSKTKKVLDTPGYFVQGTLQGFDPEKEWSYGKFAMSRIGAYSAIGLALGSLPLVNVPLLGGGIGAGIGLAQMLFDNRDEVKETIDRVTESTQNLKFTKSFDNQVAQKNHNSMEAGAMAVAESLKTPERS